MSFNESLLGFHVVLLQDLATLSLTKGQILWRRRLDAGVLATLTGSDSTNLAESVADLKLH